MHVLILAGGFGTRLKPLTLHLPKQLLKLGDKTIIEHLMGSLKKAGFTRMTLAINEAHERAFKEALKKHPLDWIIESSKNEEEKLGAVGALWNAKKHLPREPVIIAAADNFAPGIDFKRIADEHQKAGRLATLVLYRLPDPNDVTKYGVAVVDGKRIAGFQEKPKLEEAKSQLISTALYLVQPEFFDQLEAYIQEKKSRGQKPDNLGEMWQWMVESGLLIGYHVLESYWSDIGSFKGYLEANRALLSLQGTPVVKGRDCMIGESTIGPWVVIGDACSIGDGCVIKDSIVGSNVKIGDNCTLEGSIIDEGAVIGPGTALLDQVIEKGSFIN